MNETKDILDINEYQSNVLRSSHDFESASDKTEDSLLNTRSNSETTSISVEVHCCSKKSYGLCCSFVSGVTLSIISILLFIWNPFYILMETRLDMIPGLPPFEWWKDPPNEVRLRAYVFNVTNSESFLNGSHPKLKLQEIGPIVYLENLIHKNVHFNKNGTLTYTANRSAIYLPDENSLDLNSTIIVPNYALLGVASYLSESSIFTKMGFNMFLRGMKTPMFVETTLYNFLWNLTDSILPFAKTMTPDMVPDLNIGMLHMIYRQFEDNATVYIGNGNGHEKFFLMDKFDGSKYLPGHGSSCADLIVNSTEGALYPQYINKNTTLRYWRKTLCKVTPLYYDHEKYMDDYQINTYKFTKTKHMYDRNPNLEKDCYKGKPVLPSGLMDVSKCYNGVTMAASYPHYLYASDEVKNYVEGLNPNVQDHESFIYVEPLTGIPIVSTARSQSNMVVKDMSGFTSDLQKFSNIAIPMFWLEYNQNGLPYYVKYLLIFTLNIVPTYQYYFTSFLLGLGFYFLVISYRKFNKKGKTLYENNTNIHFEQEIFIKKN